MIPPPPPRPSFGGPPGGVGPFRPPLFPLGFAGAVQLPCLAGVAERTLGVEDAAAAAAFLLPAAAGGGATAPSLSSCAPAVSLWPLAAAGHSPSLGAAAPGVVAMGCGGSGGGYCSEQEPPLLGEAAGSRAPPSGGAADAAAAPRSSSAGEPPPVRTAREPSAAAGAGVRGGARRAPRPWLRLLCLRSTSLG
jgi:hypothetical protein